MVLQEEEMEKSDSRSDRVAQILAELGSSEAVVKPTWSSAEMPEKVSSTRAMDGDGS